MNSNLARENESAPLPTTRFTAIWRWLPIVIILAAAAAYYGSYMTYWFNPHDEGGFACLVTQRLLNGERPWVDVETGYNIGWFYPLIALFKVTGVNYLAARGWFFVLSTITALLGFGIVSRISGSRLLGLGAGLLLVVLPGSQFKNYIQLAQAANTACLVYLAFVDPAARKKWFGAVALGGFVLGLTFLVRVELGFFFTAIWLLLLLVFLLDRRLPAVRRFGATLGGIALLAGGVVVAQAPAYLELRGRGLEPQYWAEYSGWVDFLQASLRQKLHYGNRSTLPPAAQAPVPNPNPAPASPTDPRAASGTLHSAQNADRNILPRKPISDIWKGAARDKMLASLTYAPFIGFAIFLVAGLAGVLWSIVRGEFKLTARPFLWVLLVGASLTTFPQFFFFRPDRPHLSEFMTGYMIAMSACLWLLWPRGEPRRLIPRAIAWTVALFLVAQLGVYTTFAMQHPSSGTIAARFGKKAWFHGENGVHVREFKRQATNYKEVYDAVLKASGPDDYVICFPYMPGYNVMTNRRTYLRNVYVDNATRSVNWSAETIRDLEEKKPAIVITDDRAINGVEESRFSKWAPEVVAYLRQNYRSAAKSESVEVFARSAPPAP